MAEFYLIFLLVSFLLFVGVKVFSIWIKTPSFETVEINKVSILIPFRNEQENLPQLLQSLAEQASLPQDILFVNDHSDDESERIVQSFIEEFKIGQLLTLPNNISGKKAALNYGIQLSKTPYVLTLDADVSLNKHYMKTLQNQAAYGLTAFPVIMKGNTFLERLFSSEYTFFNAFNYLISSIWPISISGANLLFNSSVIDYENQLKNHQHLASGDDYFLLKTFRSHNVPIYISNTYELSVETNAPYSFKSYFDQRVRWLSKSKFQVDGMDVLIGIFISIYFIGGFVALILSACLADWTLLNSIFIIRFLIDSLVYLNYAQGLRATQNVLILPFFQLFYPLLFITVAILSLFYKPKWKGRKID